MQHNWQNSTRAQRLPGNWRTLRLEILKRDGYRCQIALDGCTGAANEVDHIQPGDNHDPSNLRAACTWCNKRSNIATRPKRPSMYRTPERHPGLRY